MIRLPLTTEEMLTHGSKSSRKILVDVFRYYREKLMMTNSLYSCPNVIHLYPMGKWARTYEISIPPRSRVKFSMIFLWFPPWVYFFFPLLYQILFRYFRYYFFSFHFVSLRLFERFYLIFARSLNIGIFIRLKFIYFL